MAAEIEQSQGVGRIKVDLENCVIVTPGGKKIPFGLDAIRREALLQGQDAIEQTMQWDADIAAFEKQDRERFPWIYVRG